MQIKSTQVHNGKPQLNLSDCIFGSPEIGSPLGVMLYPLPCAIYMVKYFEINRLKRFYCYLLSNSVNDNILF